MSAEKFFCGESYAFLFVFWVLFLVLYGVSRAVFAGLACACMLVSVEFHVGMRGVWMLGWLGFLYVSFSWAVYGSVFFQLLQ